MLVAYVAAFARPLMTIESSNADRTLITWIGYAGFLLLCADGVPSRERLDVLLRRLTWGGSYMAFVALLQFFTNQRIDLAQLLQPPGLTFNEPDVADQPGELLPGRLLPGGGDGACTPSSSPSCVAAILPIAIHYAFADTQRGLLARWTPVVIMGFAMPLALSRSGFLALALAGICILPALPATRRLHLAALGTGRHGRHDRRRPRPAGDDQGVLLRGRPATPRSAPGRRTTSTSTRSSANGPSTGRGFGTFVPTVYDFLDNQYLLTAIETGVIGVVCLLLFLFSGMATAQVVRKYSTDRATRSLAQALFAGIVVHAVTFATYDALVFPTTGMTLFLIIGAVGALWRLTRPERLELRRAALASADGGPQAQPGAGPSPQPAGAERSVARGAARGSDSGEPGRSPRRAGSHPATRAGGATPRSRLPARVRSAPAPASRSCRAQLAGPRPPRAWRPRSRPGTAGQWRRKMVTLPVMIMTRRLVGAGGRADGVHDLGGRGDGRPVAGLVQPAATGRCPRRT